MKQMNTPPFVKLCSLAFALTLLAGGRARATDYYISPAGSDANDGTAPNKAWQTIDRANKATLRPGDRILFEGGRRFSGNLLIAASGTREAFLEIGSYGNGPATIQAGDSYAIRLLNCQYIKVGNLMLLGSGVKPNGETTNRAQGLDIYSTATEGNPWQSIYVDKLTVSGFRDGIVLHTPIGTQKVVGYNDVRVTNCTIKECLLGGFYCWGSERSSGKPWNFPLGAGLFANCYLGGCTIYNIYGDPVGDPILCLPIQIFNATSFLVERCTIHHCGQAQNPKGSLGGVGGLVFLECAQSVAQFNECHHIVTKLRYDGCAFDIDGGCTDCILQYNYSHDNEGSGFQAGTFQGSSPTTGVTIRYNISENDVKKNPDNSGAIMTWAEVGKGQIYNNTVFISAGFDGKPAAFLGSGGGFTVRNNIFVVSHDGDIVYLKNPGGYKFQNNCYYRAKGDFSVRSGEARFNSLSAWQTATGQEKLKDVLLGFQVDPQFRTPGGAGTFDDAAKLGALNAYDLLQSSPVMDKGLDLQAMFGIAPGPSDFRGAPLRTGGKYDLGAVDHK